MKRQFVRYRLVQENLVNTLNGFVQEICPIGRPLKKESFKKSKLLNSSSQRYLVCVMSSVKSDVVEP